MGVSNSSECKDWKLVDVSAGVLTELIIDFVDALIIVCRCTSEEDVPGQQIFFPLRGSWNQSLVACAVL